MGIRSERCGGSTDTRYFGGSTVSVLTLALGMAIASLPARAQQGGSGGVATQSSIAFDIPAQSLNSAVLAFADRSGVQVFYDVQRVSGLRSSPVRGTYSREQALARLLAGTGVTYRFSGNTVSLTNPARAGASAAAEDGSLVLDTITVEGQSESAWGPVNGLVARRSATGTKTDTPIIEVPRAINVIGREEIETRGVRSVEEALSYTPGVSTGAGRGNVGHDELSLRGFGAQSSHFFNGLRAIALDDYQVGAKVDPFLIERIEVLKGPASALYGQAIPGGIVNYVSKKPTFTPVNEIGVTGGTHENAGVRFDFGGPIPGTDDFAYRLVGVANRGSFDRDGSWTQRLLIAPSVTWRPSDDTHLTVLGILQRDTGDFSWNSIVPPIGSLYPNPNGRVSRSVNLLDPSFDGYHINRQSVGYQFEHRFNESIRVRQNLQYQNYDYEEDRLMPNGLWLLPDRRTIGRMAIDATEENTEFAVDNNAEFKFDTGNVSHTLLAGFDYRYIDNMYLWLAGGPHYVDLYNPTRGPAITRPTIRQLGQAQSGSQYGLYAQDQLRFGSLIVTGGLRQDWTDFDALNLVNNQRSTHRHSSTTGSIGVTYLFDNGLAPYASYATSFQPTFGVNANGSTFVPTTAEQYEVGLKYQPAAWNALFTLSAFDITRENVVTTDPTNLLNRIQVGEARSRGFEFEAKAEISDSWNAIVSYAYLDAKVTKDTNIQGNFLQKSPRHTFALWSDYTFNAGTLKGLTIGAGARYTSSYYGDTANALKIEDRILVDASLKYDLGAISDEWKGAEVSVAATNLFDKTYVNHCLNPGYCFYGTARTITANLTYKW